MDQGRTLDLAALVAPIPGGVAVGVNLRDTSAPGKYELYLKIKDARVRARDIDRRAEREGAAAGGFNSEWRTLLELSEQVLVCESKDLEIACWLVDALVRAQGFSGFRDGLLLLNQLLTTYWNELVPHTEADPIADCLKPLTQLNGEVDGSDGTLIQPIRMIALTAGGPPGPFAAYHHQQALALAQVGDKATRERRIAAGTPTVELFEQALRSSPRDFLRRLHEDLTGSQTAFEALQTLLLERCAKAMPPTSRIRSLLDSIADIVRPHTAGLVAAKPPGAGLGAPTDVKLNGIHPPQNTTPPESPPAIHPVGVIMNRNEALDALRKVSAYFRTAEPHSPVAFVLEDLIRRANMSFPELLAELLPDATARRAFLMNAGIKPDPPPAAGGTAQKS
jgi:type VI secretion system protein ImpA